MPYPKLPNIREGKDMEQSIQFLTDAYNRLRKEIGFLMMGNLGDDNIDSLSVNRLTAGTIKAKISIESPEIIGGIIEGGEITIGSGDNVFKADEYGIYAGSTDYMAAPFSVDMSGSLYATNAYIEGKINSSSIEGGTITGAVIATAPEGYERMVFSGDGFLSCNELNQKEGICIETGDWGFSSLNWYDDSGSLYPVGGIAYDTLGNFNIISGTDINIQIWASDDLILTADGYVLPQGTWNFNGASVTNLWDGTYDYVTTEYAAQKGVDTNSDSHSHTVVVDGVTYTTSSNSHSHGQN
jgi:hypothetical protein